MINALSNRSHYPCLREFTYLNQASIGLICKPAVDSMHTFLNDVAQHGNVNMSDEDELNYFEPLRTQASQLFNCNSDNLAILASASELLSQAPYILHPAPKSIIILIESDFPSITKPWIAYAKKYSCKVIFIKEIIGKSLTESIIEQIDNKTAVVAVSYVQFSTGSQVDVVQLRKSTELSGARLIIDVTQAAGAIPIECTTWNADIVVSSGYKWLGGHGGVAFAIISTELLKKLPPFIGWMSAPNPFEMIAVDLAVATGARRYTQATMSYISINCLTVSIREILRIGPEKIKSHTETLANYLKQGLNELGWSAFTGNTKNSEASHILSIAKPNSDMNLAMREFRSKKLVCGCRNSRLRISLAHYNDQNDIVHLLNLLKTF